MTIKVGIVGARGLSTLQGFRCIEGAEVVALCDLDKPAIDVYDACEWTAVAMLSELSVMNGGRAMEMPDFRKSASRGEQIIKL